MTGPVIVDLFAGAGGTSEGAAQACAALGIRPSLHVAVNHDETAIASHTINHPEARHYCASVDGLEPREAVPQMRADLIIAGCECTHHSRARGGKPKNEQSRSSAWHVLKWAEELRAREILIENVPEFQGWGPLDDDGKVIPERKGETFAAFIQAVRSLGYAVEWRVLMCADYGDPTTRRRLFIRASRGRRPAWPTPSHVQGERSQGERKPWRAARECIDWTVTGASIFTRKKPLVERTIRRIAAGIVRYCGPYADLFLTEIEKRLDVVVSRAEMPSAEQTTEQGMLPFVVSYYGQSTATGIDQPLPTVTAGAFKHYAAFPFILPHDQHVKTNGLRLVDSVYQPFRTITASGGGNGCVINPFIVPQFGERPGQEPRTHSIDNPLPTVTASKGAGAFVLPYYRTGQPQAIGSPLPTVTTVDRFALIEADKVKVDIYFRMLEPCELAAAQGFPDGYRFTGNRRAQVRQVGNAVPVNTAKSLCLAALADHRRPVGVNRAERVIYDGSR